LSANPNSGFRFSKWTGNVFGYDVYIPQMAVLIDRNRSITANFFTRCGDVTGDTQISPSDSQTAFDIFLGRAGDPTEAQLENADVNCDGTATAPRVTPKDAHAIFKYYLGKNSLPGDCSCASRTQEAAVAALRKPSRMRRSVTIGDVRGKPGDTVLVPILLDTPDSLESFGLDLIYPSNLLKYKGVSRTGLSLDFVQLDGNELRDGLVRIGGYRNEPLANGSGGALVTVIFEVQGSPGGQSPLLASNTIDDLNGAQVNPGQVQISSGEESGEKNRPHSGTETHIKK
jgi:hypothetical protein